jgi:hypothetical protein
MKCLAMRVGGVSHHGDVDDIRRLAELLGIRTSEEAIELITRYYPAEALPPRTRFGLEEIFGQGEE